LAISPSHRAIQKPQDPASELNDFCGDSLSPLPLSLGPRPVPNSRGSRISTNPISAVRTPGKTDRDRRFCATELSRGVREIAGVYGDVPRVSDERARR